MGISIVSINKGVGYMNIIKRDGRQEQYEEQKIIEAIEKAMKYGSGIVKEYIAKQVAKEITDIVRELGTITIFQVEDLIFNKLVEKGQKQTAKAYEGYRAVQEFKREENTTDDSILKLLYETNKEVAEENSNKDAELVTTKRDLMAGEISKDIVDRFMYPPHLIQAHKDGILQLHDKDYLAQQLHNCEVINLADMLKNGTKMNKKTIKQPNSFQVASTVTTQIIQVVTSSSYGGASINGIDRILAPYARKSYEKYYKKHKERLGKYIGGEHLEKEVTKYADIDMRKEIKDGVQTIQYQINTMNTTQGQSPFVTFMLYFLPDYEYAYEASIIQEEFLRQRYEGMENEIGIKTPTSFPKLIYVLDEHNINKESEYYYLTELAAKATAKTLMPDYISAKKMKEIYEGNVFVPINKSVA